MTNVIGFTKKNKNKIVYPDCESALKPVPHSLDIPVPVPPAVGDIESQNSSDDIDLPASDVYMPPEADKLKQPHLINHLELNDLVRDLELSKQKSELLG